MNKKLQKAITVGSAIATVLMVSPLSVFADDSIINLQPTTGFGATVSQFKAQGLLRLAINLILALSGLIAFFWLLSGGIQWILAGGDKEGTEKARKRITSALIGLAIVFSTYALIFLIGGLFNLDLLNVQIPSYQ